MKPGGSAVTLDTIFVTNKKVIIRNPTMLGAAIANKVAMGRAHISKRFMHFSTATFRVDGELTESFEKTGYITAFTIMLGMKKSVSKRRYPAPYQPTTAAEAIKESKMVSMR